MEQTTVRQPPPADEDDVLPELGSPAWLHHVDTFAATSFWSVARRLPAIVREALSLAWQANKRDTSAAIGLNIFAGVATTFGLLATSTVLTELFAAGPTPDRIKAAVPALVAAAVAVSMRGGLTIAAGWAQARITPQINYAVELRLFGATTAVGLAAFDDPGFAEEMDRAKERGMTEAASIVNSSVDLFTGLVRVAATAAAIAVIEPILLPCLIVAAIPSAITAVRMARREYLAMIAYISRRRRMWLLGSIMANRHTAAEVRSYQMRDFLLGEYSRVMQIQTGAEMRLIRAQTGTRTLGAAFGGFASLALYAVLGWLLVDGAIPLAAAATALLALQAAQMGLNTAVYATNQLYEDALYYGDFRDFVDRARERAPEPGGRPVSGFEEIRLDRVSLHYPDTDAPAVDEVSLTLRKGQVIALVGENGSGKSSLAKLLSGLYQPTGGRISWDGADIGELDPDSRAAQVAVITQDWWKFPFTAHQNIAVGRRERGDGPSVTDAAGAALAHEMIEKLPKGYATLLNRQFKDGHDLSGGEWQRLVAARGFYRDAPLLICDEPSSALDARAEHAMFQQLRRRPDRTVVLITHRLANVRHADQIYVLHHGRIVQHGTHDDLVGAGGLYQELFHLQASGYLA
ncbi:ATP-binding cassette subfamily B protein/ATP-binding cassette subfamily C protein [Asanoa ferruginea]|uniref:ATP-binding cassette subfamily B protein/ATP-binding cassette subfamily C protein n=1 Tax=Asanoa ferruginea TaxID=53367 RepID=A0A3D9ZF40_9ACTN|nr:ABC transporter ATP-binding protein [Asanoa ferruginea]REF95875.1 ATP-binding cassette subfamily B protein/ATP-binding cassette subfamily C protein [Asanoa ferruginea]GIF53514.1 multidrug ABC transporter permease [Asanoa ferruginea]